MLRFWLNFLLLFSFCASALAQSDVAGSTLNGTISDPSGAPVPSAKITVVNPATGLTRNGSSTETGFYSFTRLPAGQYDLTVEMNGFKTVKQQAITLNVGAVATLDLRLEVGQVQETVAVTAEVPVVEATRSQTSTNVDSVSVSELPINGRNFLDFTALTPGVTRDPTRGGDLSFGGQRGTSNSLLVDGQDANNTFFGQSLGRAGTGRNPYSFSQDAVQEFQVNTNGYAAEIGRAGGGVINVITKSGTNDPHGTAFWFYRDKALNANTWANNRLGRAKAPYHFNQFGGNIGGPVIRNKLFYFLDYDGQRNTAPNVVFLQVAPPSDAESQAAARELQPALSSYVQKLDNDVALAKADWEMTTRQRLSVRYNLNRFRGANFENGGAASAAEHTGNSNVTTDNIAVQHTAIRSAATVLESRFNLFRDDEPGLANSDKPEAIVRQNGITVMQVGRNSFSPRYTNLKSYQFLESVSHVRGNHTYKIGLDLNFQRIDNFFPGNFGGTYTFNSYADFAARRAFSFTQGFAGDGTDGPLTKPNASEYAFYAQDSWRVNRRLTLNYGVRYDYFAYAQPKVKNPDAGLASLNLDTSRIPLDGNNFAPRLGVAYKLADRIVLRGGYGIFYGRTPSIMTGTSMSQNGIQVQTYTLRQGDVGLPVYPAILAAPPAVSRRPDIYVFDPNFKQPMTHQWSFNYEMQVGRDYGITLGYLGVNGTSLGRTRDVNLLTPVLQPNGILRYPGRINANFGRISMFDAGGASIYHGSFLQVSKRYSRHFLLQSSYTLSKVIDTVPDQTSVVVGGGDDAKVPQYTLYPDLDRGRGNSDIRHRFVFSGVWDLNYAQGHANPVVRWIASGYQLSAITTLQSGRPYTITVPTDQNNDGNTRTDRPAYVGRNTYEGPGFNSIDARFTKDIPLSPDRARLRLMLEAFNLANRPNYNAIITTPGATFGTPTNTSDQRILQLAAKITF